MDTLRIYYRGRLKMLAALIVAVALLYHGFLLELQQDGRAAPLLVSGLQWFESVLVTVMFLGGEWFIRTGLWKIERPSLDFSGDWDAETTYTHVEKAGQGVPEGPLAGRSARHDVTIEQDCFGISIAPTAGAYNNWYSLAMNILGDRQIGYAYEVSYKNSPGFPQRATGYERMTVVEWEKRGLKKGRPLVMRGEFAHCVQPNEPAYRGTVVFVRRGSQGAGEAAPAALAAPAEIPAGQATAPAAAPASA